MRVFNKVKEKSGRDYEGRQLTRAGCADRGGVGLVSSSTCDTHFAETVGEAIEAH